MKTAREMFEELGFKQEIDEYYIIYEFMGVNGMSVYFYKHREIYDVRGLGYTTINAEIHKAITKQLEELGWLDE